MSLRLLVDEDTQSRRLVALLRQAGHDVLTANEAGLRGNADATVLEHARSEGRLVLTRNVGDFRELHEAGAPHAGIAGIFFDSDPSKDLSNAAIVGSLANLEAAGIQIAGAFHALNAWNWRPEPEIDDRVL